MAAATNSLFVGSRTITIDPIVNPDGRNSRSKAVVKYVASLNGMSGIAALVDDTTSLAQQIGNLSTNATASKIHDVTDTFFSVTNLGTLPEAIGDAAKACNELRNRKVSDYGYKIVNAAKEVTNATLSAISAVGFVMQNSKLVPIPVITALKLTKQATSLQIAVEDLSMANRLEAAAATSTALSDDIKKNITETKRYKMLVTTVKICSMVGGILGLALLAVGGSFALATVLIVLSIAGTILSISGDFYKKSRAHDILDLRRLYHPTHAPVPSQG
jgi:hypothetical protein